MSGESSNASRGGSMGVSVGWVYTHQRVGISTTRDLKMDLKSDCFVSVATGIVSGVLFFIFSTIRTARIEPATYRFQKQLSCRRRQVLMY